MMKNCKCEVPQKLGSLAAECFMCGLSIPKKKLKEMNAHAKDVYNERNKLKKQ